LQFRKTTQLWDHDVDYTSFDNGCRPLRGLGTSISILELAPQAGVEVFMLTPASRAGETMFTALKRNVSEMINWRLIP
jgi:hypothetical protein